MARYFGTDGIRGRAGEGKLSPASLEAMARAIGAHFGTGCTAVIGRDTRESGPELERALIRGLSSQGIGVKRIGVLPTPATAFAVPHLNADLGLMITASHNPWHDNGVKLFGSDGRKVSDADQDRIETWITTAFDDGISDAAVAGEATDVDGIADAYVEVLLAAFRSTGQESLNGLRLVVDCANGAAFRSLPAALDALDADIVLMGADPDGRNINAGCGSTHPEALAKAVLDHGAKAGIALDGDADRLIMVDAKGRIVDGDAVMARLATDWIAQGRLKGGRVVSTVMSNLGFERYLETLGLTLDRTPVGDRHVAARMAETGANLGGEPSGHLLLTDYGPTGDGSLAALMSLASMAGASMAGSDGDAADHFQLYTPYPQQLVNVRYSGASPMEQPAVTEAIAKVDARLGDAGRVLVRASGTEPLIRIMAEGLDAASVSDAVEELRAVVAEAAS
ncbi:MAG: phosphoglucosamine mutase [Litorimonas sp.]